MTENKMFLRDFMTQAKIKKYILYMLGFAALIKLFFQDKTIFYISDIAGSMIGLGIAFTSTAYIIYTYSTLENIKFYLTLPIKKWKMFLAYFLALWICTLIQRISFVIIIIADFGTHVVQNIILLVMSSAAAVLINIGILLGKNAKERSMILWNVILICALFFLGYSEIAFGYKLLLSFCIGVSAICTYQKVEITDLVITHQPSIRIQRRGIVNYFFRVAMAEKIYITNTVCIVAFLVVLCVMSKNNPIMMSLVWCIGSVNTPFLTMISGDLWIARQIDMLPIRQNNIYKQYSLFLASYFLLTNFMIVLVKYIILKEVLIKDILLALLLVILETVLAIMLEKTYRVKGWQTKQELWKNPRKYILPFAIFVFVSFYNFV